MKEALKLALEALEKAHHAMQADMAQDEIEDALTAIKEALAQPSQEPVAHDVIAGVLFDFMAWLTSRPKRIMLSSADDASPAVDAIRDFAKMRGLSLDDAKVQDWQEALAQRKPLFKEFIKWAGAQGYDCAQTCNSDTGEWIALNPMTTDLWKAWQAAHGIKE